MLMLPSNFSGVTLTVTPAVFVDGQDAFVGYSGVPDPSPQDYISVSCGPTLGLDDFIDAQYVGPSNGASITNVCRKLVLQENRFVFFVVL